MNTIISFENDKFQSRIIVLHKRQIRYAVEVKSVKSKRWARFKINNNTNKTRALSKASQVFHELTELFKLPNIEINPINK